LAAPDPAHHHGRYGRPDVVAPSEPLVGPAPAVLRRPACLRVPDGGSAAAPFCPHHLRPRPHLRLLRGCPSRLGHWTLGRSTVGRYHYEIDEYAGSAHRGGHLLLPLGEGGRWRGHARGRAALSPGA